MINLDSENTLKVIKNLIFHIYIKYFNIYYYFIRNIVVKNELFMNDMIIFENDEVLIEEIKIKLSSHFKMKNLRIMKYFLELEIECNSYEDIIISQRYYIEYILE